MDATIERDTRADRDSADSDSPALTVLRRIFAEGFATGNADVVDELCAPDLVEHQFGLAGTGAEARQHVKDAVEDGDTIWARVRVRGTASGPFFGPPSHRPVELTVIDVARVVDGRIVEHWGVPDRFALLAQTGVLARLR